MPTDVIVSLDSSDDVARNNNNINNSRDEKHIKNICITLVNKYILKVVRGNINWTGLYTIGCSAGP